MSTYKLTPVLYLAACGILAITTVANSQTRVNGSNDRAREELIQSIKRTAEQDARTNRPGQTAQDLHLLFGTDASATGLKLVDIKSVYDEAYATGRRETNWWRRWRPNLGWLVAALLLLLHFVRDALKEQVSRGFKSLTNIIYERLASFTFVQHRSLRKYRASLVNTYSKFKLPFRADVELSMEKIYVPLKVAGTGNTDQIDSLSVIAEHTHLIILGTPGAGKSILLKRLALHYGSNQLTLSFDAPTRAHKSSKTFRGEFAYDGSRAELWFTVFLASPVIVPVVVGSVSTLLLTTPAAIYFATLFFLKSISIPLICIIWAAVLISVIALWNNALKQERKSNSPLLAMFDRISSTLR